MATFTKKSKKSKLDATVGKFAKKYTACYHLQQQDPNYISSILQNIIQTMCKTMQDIVLTTPRQWSLRVM